jgi:hypothetical protein
MQNFGILLIFYSLPARAQTMWRTVDTIRMRRFMRLSFVAVWPLLLYSTVFLSFLFPYIAQK